MLAKLIVSLRQVTFLTTRTSTGSKVDVFHQSQPLTQSSDVTHAVRVVKNVTCLSSLLFYFALNFKMAALNITYHVRKIRAFIGYNIFTAELITHNVHTRCDPCLAWTKSSNTIEFSLTVSRVKFRSKNHKHMRESF